MRRFLWLFLIMGMVLILAGCQAGAAALLVEGMPEQSAPAQPAVLASISEPAAAETPPAAEPAPDECLECHADKERLIDTAKPEEGTAESESKGVG